MADERTAAALLAEAASLIERATIKLDMTETSCAGCGRRHFKNMPHAKAYEIITNMPSNLGIAISRLDGTYEEKKSDRFSNRARSKVQDAAHGKQSTRAFEALFPDDKR